MSQTLAALAAPADTAEQAATSSRAPTIALTTAVGASIGFASAVLLCAGPASVLVSAIVAATYAMGGAVIGAILTPRKA